MRKDHERFVLAAMANRYSRVLLEESVKYGRQRRTFGRRLLDHQVLRHKIADMAGRVEAVHALLEQIAYQMKARVPDSRIGGITALAKVQATTTMEFCAREAAQIFGGSRCVAPGPRERTRKGLTRRDLQLHPRRPGGEGGEAVPGGPRQRHRRRQRGDPPGPRDEAGQALSSGRRRLKPLPFFRRGTACPRRPRCTASAGASSSTKRSLECGPPDPCVP